MGSCYTSVPEEVNNPRTGYFEIVFDLGEVKCPTRWNISQNGVVIINAEEKIEVSDFQLNGDSGSFKLPVFKTTVDFHYLTDGSIQGHFKNHLRKGDYKIPFEGHKNQVPRYNSSNPQQFTYDVNMDPEDPFNAIGKFNFYEDYISGTFLTETGDYRFLEGQKTNENNFYLSCFDGSHLFYFTAEMHGDSISGKFFSGNHWNTTWSGVKDITHSVSLINPDSLTYLKEGETSVEFFGLNKDQDTLKFNSMDFDHVSMIQILGSWCPNCMDETRYYNELSKKYGDQVNIIGLAFEAHQSVEDQLKNIQIYRNELQVEYPIYLSGNANKSEASIMFNTLNKITSYPTTIFLDKHGMVRKIHTGFYGPSTGTYYDEYTSSTEAFLYQLIAEKR